MIICREKLAEAKALARKSGKAETPVEEQPVKEQGVNNEKAEKREEIKRLLEESGAESSWIMQYLFEDQQKDPESDKPW